MLCHIAFGYWNYVHLRSCVNILSPHNPFIPISLSYFICEVVDLQNAYMLMITLSRVKSVCNSIRLKWKIKSEKPGLFQNRNRKQTQKVNTWSPSVFTKHYSGTQDCCSIDFFIHFDRCVTLTSVAGRVLALVASAVGECAIWGLLSSSREPGTSSMSGYITSLCQLRLWQSPCHPPSLQHTLSADI